MLQNQNGTECGWPFIIKLCWILGSLNRGRHWHVTLESVEPESRKS
ncbi:hypothetical protein Poly51_16450 [Rubripirellula tenax]|uniref:Uncharacterized protein n=1 Tax=Rubripirellula tenax TaxID=2528015 RepID=A0A5C6FBN9_9BACT|nr:hypothetical protein Poly51_16450 [Rubripirellula tenax]